MASKAISILKDDVVLERFKLNALNEAKRFDIQKVVPLYEEVYESAFKRRFKNK